MLKGIIIYFIKAYQNFISPYLGRNCRFYPSCSQYSYLVVRKYGALKGIFLGLQRIIKCHRWSKGGIDLPS